MTQETPLNGGTNPKTSLKWSELNESRTWEDSGIPNEKDDVGSGK